VQQNNINTKTTSNTHTTLAELEQAAKQRPVPVGTVRCLFALVKHNQHSAMQNVTIRLFQTNQTSNHSPVVAFFVFAIASLGQYTAETIDADRDKDGR